MSKVHIAVLHMRPLDGPADHAVHDARAHRTRAAANLVRGSTNPEDVADYQHWVAVSLLLSDMTTDDALACIDRAINVYEANCEGQDTPPDLINRIDLDLAERHS